MIRHRLFIALFQTIACFIGLGYNAYAQSQFIQTSIPETPLVSIEYDSTSRMLYVAGTFSDVLRIGSTEAVSYGQTDVFLAAFNDRLKLQWLRSYGGPGADALIDIDYRTNLGVALAISAGGGTEGLTTYRIGNDVYTGRGNYDPVIALVNTNGAVAWSRVDGGSNPDGPTSIEFIDDTTIVTTGLFVSDTRLGKQRFESTSYLASYIQLLTTAGVHIWATGILPVEQQAGIGSANVTRADIHDRSLRLFINATCNFRIDTTSALLNCFRDTPMMCVADMDIPTRRIEIDTTPWCDATYIAPFASVEPHAYAFSQPGVCYGTKDATITELGPTGQQSAIASAPEFKPLMIHGVSSTFVAGGAIGHLDVTHDGLGKISTRSANLSDAFLIKRNIELGRDTSYVFGWNQSNTRAIAAAPTMSGTLVCSIVTGDEHGYWLSIPDVTASSVNDTRSAHNTNRRCPMHAYTVAQIIQRNAQEITNILGQPIAPDELPGITGIVSFVVDGQREIALVLP